ncbi:hypothetical protein [Alienimonas californiensis]|nr:hypothetical protein [Alienimonas californiensis]
MATLAEFDVRPGEWARVVFNARYADFDNGQWSYARHTINVAAVDPFAAEAGEDFFLSRDPATEVLNLARLW